ncbi:MAG: T9SS type A sorting domain-containing protein [Flavobacterium sp.]|uniref:T9SS type A sorting domain-containing protein n=1 Tax=Flavobacterium sp. TaxID=239 RepID=UPI0012017930|nr:T9SS type A sorting domain-containing protein [Flavobacterium sp.]RZJ63400.1 MAG: T9SS type A sorting domain-containing protein [Flavobacterium sp.]
MKKILLLSAVLSVSALQAQFFTEKALGASVLGRGTDNMSIVSDNVVWAKLFDALGDETTVKEYAKSTDGGNTWTSATITGIGIPATLAVGSITAVSADVAWVSMYPTAAANGGIYKTINGGTSWAKQATASFSTSGQSFANIVYFWDANTGICQGDPEGGYFEIYSTTNGGTNWTRVPSANIAAPLTNEFGYVHNYDVVGTTMWFGTSLGRIYKSTNSGLNWTASQSPLTDFGGTGESGELTFSDANKGLLMSSTGSLYRTTDGGANWTVVVPTGIFGTYSMEYIPGTPSVVSSSGAGDAFYSNDDGSTWTQVTGDGIYLDLAFRNYTTGFAGGLALDATTGGMNKYTGSELLAPRAIKSAVEIAPNPTNGPLKLKGAIFTDVAVFDLAGKQVFQYNGAGQEMLEIDLSSLQNGAYLVKATTEAGALRTVKLLKY